MDYDGKLLAAAREKLSNIREKNKIISEQRQKEIYKAIPRISEIDLRLRQQMQELLKLTIEKDSNLNDFLEKTKKDNLALQEEKRELLKTHGFNQDYLDPIYNCRICKDTGYHEGKICDCLQRLYNIELTNSLSSLLKTGRESFDYFDLSLYSNIQNSDGVVPRIYMQNVLDTCKNYAEKFPAGGLNLLFQGGSGLGKTFTSGCIAKSVSERGFSVCYDTCISALDAFEVRKFGRSSDEQISASERVNRMLSSDLMILDDLGTEMQTMYTQSALYTLINARILSKKNTIISTNLSEAERDKRYSKQICSRLNGEFNLILFIGDDIRLLKKHLMNN